MDLLFLVYFLVHEYASIIFILPERRKAALLPDGALFLFLYS